MDHFDYRAGQLQAEDVPLHRIAAAVGTPFYCYSSATLRRHYRVFADSFQSRPGYESTLVAYGMKANSNIAVLRTLALEGAGADIVSGGELVRALAAGIPADRILFSGVGKTQVEMAAALDAGICQFNVESEPELEALAAVARSKGVTAPVSLRVNPDVDAGTHEKIATGKADNKFGIPIAAAPALYARAADLDGIKAIGVDVHIGSQLSDLAPFREAYRRVATLVERLRAGGHTIDHIDLGGGLGIPYARGNEAPPSPKAYADMVIETVGHLGCRLMFEPGRLIAGNAGLLVASVIYVKHTGDRTFLIVDAAMNDLLRPTLYAARHELVAVAEPAAGTPWGPVDVVGPVCETGDTFAKDMHLPPLEAGDLVAFRSAGAYGAVMASEYNSRPLVPEVLVQGGDWATVRPRPTYDEMIGRDHMPGWLTADSGATTR